MDEHRIVVSRRARFISLGDLARASEVWIAIHGYGQLAAGFATDFEPLVAPHRCVVLPEALNRFYLQEPESGLHSRTQVGATWMTREDRLADIADNVEYLDAVAATVHKDGRRIVALGFSQGVATMMRWVALGSARIDRLNVWAGTIPDDLDLDVVRHRFPSETLDVVLGERDRFATWADVDGQSQRLTAAGVAHAVHRFAGGHRIDRDTLLSLAAR